MSKKAVDDYEKIEALADRLEITEPNFVMTEALRFFLKEMHCENAVWFKRDQFKPLKEKEINSLPMVSLDENQHSICPMMAAQPFEVAQLGQWVNEVYTQLKKMEKWAENKKILNVNKGRYFLLPIVTKGDIFGYVLLIGAKKTSTKSLQLTQSLLSRTFTYSLQMLGVKETTFLDHLTPLYNQKYLSVVLEREIKRGARYGGKFSVLFMDIDYFKNVNDSHGHLVGSQIITELGDLIQDYIRESDYGFRFGGDEFVVVLVETDAEQAKIVAERIRKMVEEKKFVVNGHDCFITVSVGISTFPDHAKTKEEILSMADQAMYHGKNTTKNVVYVAS